MTTTGPGAGPGEHADRLALAAEQRWRDLGRELLATDERREHARGPDRAELGSVLAAVTAQIRREARAGRDIALTGSGSGARLVVTEGALRGLLRARVDDVPDVVGLRCAVAGDLSGSDAPLAARLAISVAAGRPLPAAATAVRAAVVGLLTRHTGRPAGAVDVEVADLHDPTTTDGSPSAADAVEVPSSAADGAPAAQDDVSAGSDDLRAALLARLAAVPGLARLHPARPIPGTRAQAPEPTVRVRADHVEIAVGLAVAADHACRDVAASAADLVATVGRSHHPGLPVRVVVRVVDVEPGG